MLCSFKRVRDYYHYKNTMPVTRSTEGGSERPDRLPSFLRNAISSISIDPTDIELFDDIDEVEEDDNEEGEPVTATENALRHYQSVRPIDMGSMAGMAGGIGVDTGATPATPRPLCLTCGREINEERPYQTVREVDRIEGNRRTQSYGFVCNECVEQSALTQCRNCGGVAQGHRQNYPNPFICEGCQLQVREQEARRQEMIIERQHSTSRHANLKSKDHQDDKTGTYIKSLRKFGVELESIFKDRDKFREFAKQLSSDFGLVGDGSISAHGDYQGAVEIVSPIMAGRKGEDAIVKLCELARKYGIDVNKTCGYHLHLSAEAFQRNPRSEEKVTDETQPQARLRYVIKDGAGRVRKCDQLPPNYDGKYNVEATPERRYKMINRGVAFKRLKDLLAFYTVFDDVFRAMQPRSRRFSRYCKSLSGLYSFDEVQRLQHYDEVETLWYREQKKEAIEGRKHHRYDSSRYCGLNLHSVFKNGTVELRYHSPTLNPEKILRWVNIHQTALDRIVEGFSDTTLNDLRAIHTNETNVRNRAEAMCQFLGLSKETTDYVFARIKKFLDKGEDTEIK